MRVAKKATDKSLLAGLVMVVLPGGIPATAAYLLYKKVRRKYVRTDSGSDK